LETKDYYEREGGRSSEDLSSEEMKEMLHTEQR
jgi:hypothetical protein